MKLYGTETVVGIKNVAFGLIILSLVAVSCGPKKNIEVMPGGSNADKYADMLPESIGENITFDKLVIVPDSAYQYYFTITDITVETANIDSLNEFLWPAVKENVNTIPSVSLMWDNKQRIEYYFKDCNGELFYTQAMPYRRYKNFVPAPRMR